MIKWLKKVKKMIEEGNKIMKKKIKRLIIIHWQFFGFQNLESTPAPSALDWLCQDSRYSLVVCYPFIKRKDLQ
jgi:hypothetical protein